MARALSFRQICLPSFSFQRSRTITREYSQIINGMGKEGRSVYLYVDLYLSGWQRPILGTEDSTIQPALLALLVLQS